MDVFELPVGVSPRERGIAHGEHFRARIHEIAQLRTELAFEQSAFDSTFEVIETARLHLPVLEVFDQPLFDELMGIAEGADLDPAKIVVLNHYTDLKDVDPKRLASAINEKNEDEDCSAIVAGTPEGVFLAQTWDMHGSVEPYVVMLKIPKSGTRPAVWSFTITGCLALAGMNALGVGVTINNLKSRDARVGVVWPALVRRLLAEAGTDAAKHVLMTAPMSSGHHYLIADREKAVGVETSGEKKAVVFEARFATQPNATFIHTNHCQSPDIDAVSWVSDTSTTHDRQAWLEASISARPIEGRHDLWTRLGSHEGYPRSVCTHLASDAAPHAMKTCGGMLTDPDRRALYAHRGCINGTEPTRYGFGGDDA
jgi:isopenicillin-N N-acyltransferase-like protein